MAGRRDFVLRGIGITVVAGVLAGGGAYVIQDDPPASNTANIWVDTSTSGNGCVYHASPAEYATNDACSTFDAAWDAMSAGDSARVQDGTYGPQTITGDKASDTTFIGESKAGVVIGNGSTASCPSPEFDPSDESNGFCFFGDHTVVEDMTITTLNDHSSGGGAVRSFATASNITIRNVDIFGDQPTVYITGPFFTWDGGQMSDPNDVPFRTCDDPQSQVVQIEDTNDTTLNNVIANPWTTQEDVAGANCGGDNTPHLEWLRVQGRNDNLTLNGVVFKDDAEWGSGMIFLSGSASSSTGWKFINNVFFCNRKLGSSNCAGQWTDCNPAWPSGSLWLYNTWVEDYSAGAACFNSSGTTWVGNLAPAAIAADAGCSTHIKNVWSGSGSCGTDTFTGGAASALGIDGTTGKLEVGSPAIDAAETPGASDYCTDAATVNSLDFEDTVRPQGSICDAGADER